MSFEIRDSRGRRVNSFKDLFKQVRSDILSAALARTQLSFKRFVEAKTKSLLCPRHGKHVALRSVEYEGSQMSAKFESCCAVLQTLAEEAVQDGLNRNEFRI